MVFIRKPISGERKDLQQNEKISSYVVKEAQIKNFPKLIP